MQLVADRFAVDDDGSAFDLATGARITLIVGSAGGVSEQLRWTERCTMLRGLRHRAMTPLLDFGLTGESSRFEAWGCGDEMMRSQEATDVQMRATRWLRACGLSTTMGGGAVHRCGVGGAWLPDAGTGYPIRDTDNANCKMQNANWKWRIADCGLRILERPATAALAEMFQAGGDSRPHVSVLWGPAGSGKKTVVLELARIARSHGFVPLASRLIGSSQRALWQGRSLFVIAGADHDEVWLSFLGAAMRDAQPHALLLAAEEESRSIGGVFLRRPSADALAAAVVPPIVFAHHAGAVRRAAEGARGLPGRFVSLLWPDWRSLDRTRLPVRGPALPRVAERAAVYGHPEAIDERLDPAPPPSPWPVPGELARLRRRIEQAAGDLARGRHASGIRLLRQTVGSLARRGGWIDAANGSVVLAGALVRRGQARDALGVIGDGHVYATRAGEKAAMLDLAILSGHARIDLGRLDEADSVLGTAVTAARALQDPERVAGASLALARSAYWRGEYGNAETILDAAPPVPALTVRRTLLATRLALGLGDLPRAMSLVTGIAESAGPEHVPAITWVTAVVHLAVGNLAAAGRDAAATLALARAARDPQRALRARLLLAEVERGKGRPAAALAQLHRLRRVMTIAPVLVRARWDAATALASATTKDEDVVNKHARATGLAAIGLYIGAAGRPRRAGAGGSPGAPDPFVNELVAILRLCQTAADEGEVLTRVCARLRQHLHAAAAAFVSVQGERAHIVASDGARIDTAIARRAVSAAITITPHQHEDRVEAAAPIEYGGEAIGALCARWPIGSIGDLSRAGEALTMGAAVAAPAMAAALTRQAHAAPGPGDLLGACGGIAELRRSVERAAAAPFAVLIEGESGSGKELVARAIHRGSERRHKPFSALNCAALPDDLVEAELFGHARGAFTGAIAERPGVFEEAHGGTLFLDEVGELTPRAQAKMLRVIQEGELRRVGETVSRRVDVRIVSATNRPLRREVDAGRFRLDLLYRLDVVHITVPPLRDRREDVALLAEHFWREAAARVGSRATLAAATVAALMRHDWPGNVRELQNVLAALVVRAAKRGVVPPSALPPPFAESGPGESWTLDQARRTFEVRFVRAALVRTGGHRGRAAAELGVTRQGLTKLMTRLGIQT